MSTRGYFPPPEPHWESVKPESAGFDAPLLEEAVRFAMENEFDCPRKGKGEENACRQDL
jgi:hypothetical protein